MTEGRRVRKEIMLHVEQLMEEETSRAMELHRMVDKIDTRAVMQEVSAAEYEVMLKGIMLEIDSWRSKKKVGAFVRKESEKEVDAFIRKESYMDGQEVIEGRFIEGWKDAGNQVKIEDTSAEQVEVADTSAEQVEVADTSAEQVEVADTSAEQVEVEDTSAEQVEVADTSAEQVEVADTSAEQVEAEDTSAEQVEVEDTSVGRVSVADHVKIEGSNQVSPEFGSGSAVLEANLTGRSELVAGEQQLEGKNDGASSIKKEVNNESGVLRVREATGKRSSHSQYGTWETAEPMSNARFGAEWHVHDKDGVVRAGEAEHQRAENISVIVTGCLMVGGDEIVKMGVIIKVETEGSQVRVIYGDSEIDNSYDEGGKTVKHFVTSKVPGKNINDCEDKSTVGVQVGARQRGPRGDAGRTGKIIF